MLKDPSGMMVGLGGGLTPGSDNSSAITPPCSPPCDVEECEEGELVTDPMTGQMSEISDEEEPCYDSGRYYRTGSTAKELPLGCVFDSPASPENINNQVTGSPLRIIPKSPMQESSRSGNTNEDEEDLDEDILYLRLIALRSLADENSNEDVEENEDDKQLAEEMKELLEEAEVAAKESGELESAVISEVITLEDEEEDPLKGMKLNLHETYLQYRKDVGQSGVSSPCYSPTQSPIYVVPDSPMDNKDFQLVDLTSPSSPCSPPPLPPASPPAQAPPLPPLPPQEPTSYLSRHGEPLPPGEIEDPTSPLRPVSQDMDIETESEAQFFLSQQNLFPASVWDFSNFQGDQRPGDVVDENNEAEEGEIIEDIQTDQVGQKRKLNEEIDSQASQEEDDAFDEEEASLRSLLLAQVEKSKKPKTEIDDISMCQTSKFQSNQESDLTQTSKKSRTPSKRKTKENARKFKKVKVNQKPKVGKLDNRIINRSKSKTAITITEADQKKYFPNLSKKVVVNFSGTLSDDSESEDENCSTNQGQSGVPKNSTNNLFGLDLEAFLKQARNLSDASKGEKEKKTIETQKNVLTPQLKAQASRLTLEDKKKIISAKITHLSQSKQKEYQRLKEMLAKKQKEKLLKLKLAKEAALADKENQKKESNIPNQPTRLSSINEEDEETLRNTLIKEMKKKNNSTSVASSEAPGSSKESMSIEKASGGESREVKEPVETGNDNKQLRNMETELIRMRKGLSQSLFKLSAYMSQLQKETSGVDSALKYIEELKKQLKDTEELVVAREKKVDSLREVIRESHMQITIQKQEMTQKEQECIDVGVTSQGEHYKPPVDGAENIRKKLEMIRNTANKVKTSSSYSSEPSGSSEAKSGNIESGLPSDYRSPLEHLSQGKGQRLILDHSKELCRYELAGKCLDENCKMQHLNK